MPCVQALAVGAKVWGAVAEISPKELIVSLPHGLRAHVAAAEVPPARLTALQSADLTALQMAHNVRTQCSPDLAPQFASRAFSPVTHGRGGPSEPSRLWIQNQSWIGITVTRHLVIPCTSFPMFCVSQASEPLAELLKRGEAESEAEGGRKRSGVASLPELFYVGQLVRGTVIGLQEARALCDHHSAASYLRGATT